MSRTTQTLQSVTASTQWAHNADEGFVPKGTCRSVCIGRCIPVSIQPSPFVRNSRPTSSTTQLDAQFLQSVHVIKQKYMKALRKFWQFLWLHASVLKPCIWQTTLSFWHYTHFHFCFTLKNKKTKYQHTAPGHANRDSKMLCTKPQHCYKRTCPRSASSTCVSVSTLVAKPDPAQIIS